MSESNVAQDQIKAYVDRILRMKDEADAIAADVREIYNEAKGNGFDKTQLGNLVTYLRKKDKDAEKLAEGEAVFDLYLTAYFSAKGQVGTKRANAHTHASEKVDPIAALRADPALAIVEPAILKSKLQKVQTAQTEPQSAPQAGSDLTVPPSPQGQVAQIPAAVEAQRSTPVDDVGGSGEANQPETANETTAARTDVRDNSKGPDQSALPADPVAATTPPAGTQAPPVEGPIYAAPGVVIWESTPPEGVERHPYSAAFGDLGQDIHVIADDIAGAKAAPIQKIGNVILDGWARYMTARGAFGLDGQPTEYQVVQYDGTDPLIDCIRWNVGGRILSNTQKQTVVNRLCAIEPKRKAEIIKAMAEMAI